MGKPALDPPATRASQRRSHSGSLPSNHAHCRVGRDAVFYKTLFPLALPSPCKNPQTIKHLYPAFYAAIIFGSSTHGLPTAQQDCHPSRQLRCHPQRLEERLANPCDFRAALGSTNSRRPNYPTSPSRANPHSQKVIFLSNSSSSAVHHLLPKTSKETSPSRWRVDKRLLQALHKTDRSEGD